MSLNKDMRIRLVEYFEKLERPTRMGKLLKVFKIKEYQKQGFIDLVNQLAKENVIKLSNGSIIPFSCTVKNNEKELSEAMVIEYFASRKKPVTPRMIIKDLEFSCDNNYEKLEAILKQLEVKGILLKSRDSYTILNENSSLKVGAIKMPKTGNGFVGSITIDESRLNGCLPGDCVLIDTVKNGSTWYGEVIRVIERNKYPSPFVLRNGSLVPYGFSFNRKINFKLDDLKGISDGDRLALHLVENPGDNTFNISEYSLIAKKDAPDIEIKTIAVKYGYITDFNQEELEQLRMVIANADNYDLSNRVDYRNETSITIDSITANDMDDAIGFQILPNGNKQLRVHIADVAHHIKKDSPLHKRALNNGFTAYLRSATFHLFPEEIANGICSLNEKCDRLTRSYVIEYDADGNVVNFDTHLSIINSKMKMTYEDVNEILENGGLVPGYEPYIELLNNLHQLYLQLENKRIERGFLDFASSDIEIEIDQENKGKSFVTREERTAEKMIENFMVQANEQTAIYLHHLGIPTINRIHEAPDEQKIKSAVHLVNTLGYKTRHLRNVDNPKSLQFILKQLANEKEFPILSLLLLKNLKKAVYSTDEVGHYGLALDYYLHATAPIRRVVDLELQYLLNSLETDFDYSCESLVSLEKYLQQVAHHVTSREVCSDCAEREVVAMEMAAEMEKHLGEYRNGIVVDISGSGIMVRTTDNILGRVKFEQVCGGKYKLDRETKTLSCKKLNDTIRIGTYVRVKVLSASKENRTIDFAIKERTDKAKTKKLDSRQK